MATPKVECLAAKKPTVAKQPSCKPPQVYLPSAGTCIEIGAVMTKAHPAPATPVVDKNAALPIITSGQNVSAPIAIPTPAKVAPVIPPVVDNTKTFPPVTSGQNTGAPTSVPVTQGHRSESVATVAPNTDIPPIASGQNTGAPTSIPVIQGHRPEPVAKKAEPAEVDTTKFAQPQAQKDNTVVVTAKTPVTPPPSIADKALATGDLLGDAGKSKTFIPEGEIKSANRPAEEAHKKDIDLGIALPETTTQARINIPKFAPIVLDTAKKTASKSLVVEPKTPVATTTAPSGPVESPEERSVRLAKEEIANARAAELERLKAEKAQRDSIVAQALREKPATTQVKSSAPQVQATPKENIKPAGAQGSDYLWTTDNILYTHKDGSSYFRVYEDKDIYYNVEKGGLYSAESGFGNLLGQTGKTMSPIKDLKDAENINGIIDTCQRKNFSKSCRD